MHIEIRDNEVKYVQVIPGARAVEEKSHATFGYLAIIAISLATFVISLL